MRLPKKGLYQHYKGSKLRVFGVAKHSETLEDFVVYEHLDDNEAAKLWVRPLAMFLETVLRDVAEVLRFDYIGE